MRDVAILRHLARQGLQSVKRGLEVLVDLKDALRMMLTGPLTAATGLRHDKVRLQVELTNPVVRSVVSWALAQRHSSALELLLCDLPWGRYLLY